MSEPSFAFAIFETRLGWMGIVASARGLRQVVLPQESAKSVTALIRTNVFKGHSKASTYISEFVDLIQKYLQDSKVTFPDQLDLDGTTSFCRKVWEVVMSIPCGQTRSYTWVANKIGTPKATRAVGQALANNPLPLIIPCHRVIGKRRGDLGGFKGSRDLKKRLLQLEGAQAASWHNEGFQQPQG